jgi:hypothetical protein
MSLKDTVERVRRRAEELRGEVEGTIESLTERLPRPLMERPTIVLKQPLLATFRDRLRDRLKKGEK